MRRPRTWYTILLSTLALTLPLAGCLPRAASGPLPPASSGENATIAALQAAQHAFGRLPLHFVPNQGQFDPRVAYHVQGRGTSLYFTPGGVLFTLTGREPRTPSETTAPTEKSPAQRWTVALDFVGANTDVQPVGLEPTAAVVSYFKGPPEAWQTGLPTYTSVLYPELWPGIDLHYEGTSGKLKYTFVLQPGADPGQITLAYRGASAVTLTEAGELDVTTPVGGLRDRAPYAYQERHGQQVEVAAAYELAGHPVADTATYGFRLGDYDPSLPLILDPVVLIYSGFIGGSAYEGGLSIALDSAGNAYVSGQNEGGGTFPTLVGPDISYNGGASDAFVAKVNPAGTALIYAGYTGGSGTEYGGDIAVDGAGNAYVTGTTSSNNFPVSVGWPYPTLNGPFDAFAVKVNAAGTGLVYSGYFGGSSGRDQGLGIAVDGAGNAYICGGTESADFPVTPDAFDTTYNGGDEDAFVAKVNAAGTGLVWATFLGGSGTEYASDIAVDSIGDAHVVGGTPSADFPVTLGAYDTIHNGDRDVFVTRITKDGTALYYSTFLGGSEDDLGKGIAINSDREAYVTGHTRSKNFPVVIGPDLTHNGDNDAFVAHVTASGAALIYAGYIGGTAFDVGDGIAIDPARNAYLIGSTTSTIGFPVTIGPDLTHNGEIDLFVAMVNAVGNALVYAGYLGGSDDDDPENEPSIVVDPFGNAYVTGGTESVDFPQVVGPDLTHGGGTDAYVTKIGQSIGFVTGEGEVLVQGLPASFIAEGIRTALGGRVKGRFEYHDPVNKIDLQSENFALVTDDNKATISGTCTNNKTACTFVATFEDNGEPGKNDLFGMTVSDGPSILGKLSAGNIQVREKKSPR